MEALREHRQKSNTHHIIIYASTTIYFSSFLLTGWFKYHNIDFKITGSLIKVHENERLIYAYS